MIVPSYDGRISQKCIRWAVKAGIILAVILVDMLVLIAGTSLGGYFHSSFLGILIGLIAFYYAICGNMITYNLIKSSLLNLKDKIKSYDSYYRGQTSLQYKANWSAVKNAARGRLALTGSVIFFIIILFGVLVFVVTDFGIERGSGMYSLVLMGISIATIGGIVPLIEHVERVYKKGMS